MKCDNIERMENMKKNIFIIITIVLIIVAIIGYKFYNYKQEIMRAEQNNKTYNSFYEQPVLGTDLATLINKAIDNNEKNAVEKDEKGIYLNNEENSINIEVKFLELDKVIPMESINKQDVVQFVENFGTMTFKCTKIEYHEKTKNVKYMYFEQILSTY